MQKQTRSAVHRNRLVSIDVLRALAALAVVVGHVPFCGSDLPASVQSLLSAAVRMGRLGVPMFLVLSGFCIHQATARAISRGDGTRSDWVNFWKRRFWRLYPPYLAALGLSLAVYALVGEKLYPIVERIVNLPCDLLLHLLLIHNLFENYCFSLGNGPFWTLGLEEQLYALYALFLGLRRRWPLVQVIFLIFLISVSWHCGWHAWVGTDEGASQPTIGPRLLALGCWLKWPLGLWFAWVLGALAAEAHTGAVRLPAWTSRWWVAAVLAGIGLATTHSGLGILASKVTWAPNLATALEGIVRVLSGFSDLAFAGAGFVVLNRWVQMEGDNRFQSLLAHSFARLGVISYSLYLTHIPLFRLVDGWMPQGTTVVFWLLRLALLLPMSVGFAILFFWLVERHFLGRPDLGRRFRSLLDGLRTKAEILPPASQLQVKPEYNHRDPSLEPACSITSST